MLSISTISDSLTADRSKKNILLLVSEMIDIGFDWNQYLEFIKTQPHQSAWKMGWLLSHYVEQFPEEGRKHQKLMWEVLKTINDQSVQRDLWRAFTFFTIAEELEGEVYDVSVKTMCNTTVAIAARAHAMQVAYSLSLPYPELRAEIMLLLSDFHREESAALKARSRNLMKALQRKDK